jgi:hypothetical protein
MSKGIGDVCHLLVGVTQMGHLDHRERLTCASEHMRSLCWFCW